MRLIIIFLLAFSFNAFSIDNTSLILEEGKLLFRLEKASWYATDFFLEYLKDKRDSIGGYLSYSSNDKIISIFYSRFDSSRILVRLTFDSIPKNKPIYMDFENPNPTNIEKDLIIIRKEALRRINLNTDSFFRFYRNTSFNPIPLIDKTGKRVFILTGPQNSGYVLIGNDYVLYYNSNNEFINKIRLHNSLISIPYKMQDKSAIMTMHSHILSEFITSTDICTLLLYKDFVDWKSHMVMTSNYVSILNLESETLQIMTKEEYDKIK